MSRTRAVRCAGPSRRDFLQVGAIGGLGLTLPAFLRMEAAARADQVHFDSVEGTAKGVIYVYLPGGMAQQESWDPKPLAPAEYRGPLGTVKTKLTGEAFGGAFPKTAAVADKAVVCRGTTHGEAAHERGTHNMFTGYRPSPALQYPSMGSVVAHEFGPKNDVPQYVCVPPASPNEYAGTGYLSSSYAPFSVGGNPEQKGFTVRDLSLPKGVDDARFGRRRAAAGRGERALRGDRAGRRPRRRRHLLRAGLRADRQSQGPGGVRPGEGGRQDPRRLRPQPGRREECCWPAGWWRRAAGS